MKSTPKDSRRDVALSLFRLTVPSLIVVTTPRIACADMPTQLGLERLAGSIDYLAVARPDPMVTRKT